MKLRTKLTLFYTITSTVILLVFGFTLNRYILTMIDDSIEKGLTTFISRLESKFKSNGVESLEQIASFDLGFTDRFNNEFDMNNLVWLSIYDSDDRLINSTTLAKHFPIDLKEVDIYKDGFIHYFKNRDKNSLLPVNSRGEIVMRGHVGTIELENFSLKVAPAIFITDELERMERMEKVLFRSILLLIIISFITGFFFVMFMLKPITNVTKSLNRISKDDLSERLPIKKSRDELGQLVTSINRLFERLEHGLKLEKQFISDVSHEFKTPLAVMRLSIENVINSPNITDDEAERLGNVLESLYSLDFLVKKLLYLSQLEQDRCPFKPAPFNLCTTLEKVTNNLSLIAEEKGLNFKSFCREEELKLSGDEELLYIALFNIVENAVKYTERGSVQVIAEMSSSEVVISVEDSGCGIAKEQLEDIFEKFYRVDESRSGQQGYGIGLSITKRIIKLHDGRIEVESIPGMKTIFKVILPASYSLPPT